MTSRSLFLPEDTHGGPKGTVPRLCESPSGRPFPERVISLSREVAGRR